MNVIYGGQFVEPSPNAGGGRGKHTFMPYCSFAINGLFEMNSKAFLRQVNGSGNTRSRKRVISSTRRRNTYATVEEQISTRSFTKSSPTGQFFETSIDAGGDT